MRLQAKDIDGAFHSLDQYDNTDIAQNFETNTFGDITTVNGGFSNDFTLPLTANNAKILGLINPINTRLRRPYQKVEANLIDAGAIVATGYLRYKVVTNETQLQVAFFSDNTEWFNDIKDKNLADLDLSEYDHKYTNANQAAAINGSLGYTYPLIDYGKFRGLRTVSSFLIVNDTDLFPAMYIEPVVEQIYKDIGWTVSGELLADERFSRAVIPFSAEVFTKDPDDIAASIQNFTIDPVATPPATTIAGGPNVTSTMRYNEIVGTDIFLTPSGGYVSQIQITATLTQDAAGSLPAIFISVFLNNTNILLGGVSEAADSLGTKIYTVTLDSPFFISPTDFIFIQGAVISALTGDFTLTFNSGTVDFVFSTQIIQGDTVKMASVLPDMTQADFLSWVFFSFGVVPQPNGVKKDVDLGFYRTIEKNIPIAEDWSDKLDMSKTISTDYTELLNDYGRVNIITYSDDDKDQELEAYKAETRETFGQGNILIDNAHLDQTQEIYKSDFTPMINILSFAQNMYIPQIPRFVKDDDGLFEDEGSNPKVGLVTDLIPVSTLSNGSAVDLVISKGVNITAKSEITGGVVTTITIEKTQDRALATAPSVVIEISPDGSKATASCTIDANGYVDVVTIINGATGYVNNPAIYFFDLTPADTEILSDIPFTWFAKTQYVPVVDAYDLSLAYEQIKFPNVIGQPLKPAYIQPYEDDLNDLKYQSAYFHLTEVDIRKTNFLIPVYVDRFKAYFYRNKITDFRGSGITTKVELIKLSNG